MFIVQSNIVGEEIERTVIRKCLWNLDAGFWVAGCEGLTLENVVFGNKVSGAGVEGTGQKRREDEVVEGVVGIGGFYKENVEDDLREDVEDVDGGEGNGVDEDGANGVEKDLEGAEKGFSEEGIEEEGFEAGGEIGV